MSHTFLRSREGLHRIGIGTSAVALETGCAEKPFGHALVPVAGGLPTDTDDRNGAYPALVQ